MLRQLTAVSLAVSFGAWLAAPALADPSPALAAAGLEAATATAAGPTRALDEGALRYYASLGQRDRVAAEAGRLTRLDPRWRPPADLYASRQSHPDEGPLWVLFGHDRLDELDEAIRLRQAAEPGWVPSDELTAKVKGKRLRARVMALAQAADWHAIVTLFKGSGIAWAKDDAEALWAIAEAYARENDCGEAYVVYSSILTGHDDPNERRATIEHAIALVPMSSVEKLVAMGRRDAQGASEFAPIAIDLTRARISAFLHDEPANAVGADELRAFEDFVRAEKDPNEPGLVAWYAFKQADYPMALDWFKLAIGEGGDAMIAHGLAHTLRRLGLKREAEEVAYAWREPLVNNAILFIDLLEEDFTKERPPAIEPTRVARYAQVTMATESGEGAQALGWYAYNTCQYPQALQWFTRAVAWLPKEATAYGYALALERMHRGKDVRDVVNRYDGLFPKVVALAFDDRVRKPPPPCDDARSAPISERAGSARAAPVAEAQAGPDWTGRTMADTLRPATAAPRPFAPQVASRTMVPSPEAAASGADGTVPALKKRFDFPVAVPPENPLRFSALRTVSSETAHASGHEATWPLVARRVSGVGAMPYERWGFTLKPGWDGATEARAPTAAERPAPEGTLWALEQSSRERATLTLPRPGDPHPSPASAGSAAGASSLASNPDRRS